MNEHDETRFADGIMNAFGLSVIMWLIIGAVIMWAR